MEDGLRAMELRSVDLTFCSTTVARGIPLAEPQHEGCSVASLAVLFITVARCQHSRELLHRNRWHMGENGHNAPPLVYSLAMEFGELVWERVHGWTYFNRNTVGSQLVRSCDSVAANLAEGFGRYLFRDKRRFVLYARGSIRETIGWLEKAHLRGLIGGANFTKMTEQANRISAMLSGLARSLQKSHDRQNDTSPSRR